MAQRTRRFEWGLLAAAALAAVAGCGTNESAGSTGGAGGGMCAGWVVDEAEGTALEQSSGLTWQLGQAPEELDWQDAQTYCKGLSPAGSSSWSLPTEAQLTTLLLLAADPDSGCFIDGCVFGQSSCELFWSSTPAAGAAGDASFVDYEIGYGDVYSESSPSSVRCVR